MDRRARKSRGEPVTDSDEETFDPKSPEGKRRIAEMAARAARSGRGGDANGNRNGNSGGLDLYGDRESRSSRGPQHFTFKC